MRPIDRVEWQIREAFRVPPRLPTQAWAEAHCRLPSALTHLPGPIETLPYFRGIFEAWDDPGIPFLTMVKGARLGATTAMMQLIASASVNTPGPIMAVQPTADDARAFSVDFEAFCAASPDLRGLLGDGEDKNGRSTIMQRRLPGGTLTFAYPAPRLFRRIPVKFLFYDETDAGEATGDEGNPIALATMRTQQFRDRKRFCASTPVMKDGPISQLYAESDQRIYETPCPHCGAFFELTWATIQWPEGDPAAAYAVCPQNGCIVEEGHKGAMIEAGRWRATNPAVADHAGFLLRTLVSLNYNARWGQLAREFVAAKRDPETLRTFVNLVLAEGWAPDDSGFDEHELAARAEPISLDRMPAEVLWLTAGIDCQDDRLEVAILGHQRDGEAAVLGYRVLWGPVDEEAVWRDLDDLLRQTWAHPTAGAHVGISAAAVDGSDGDHLPHVGAFCRGRFGRRVVRIKGVPGFARAPLQRSTQKGSPWFIVGVDAVKSSLLNRLARPGLVRFSDELPPEFYEQLCSERIVSRYSRGRPIRAFERVKGARAEALDAVAYALAVKGLIGQNLDAREAELASQAAPAAKPRVARSRWMERG